MKSRATLLALALALPMSGTPSYDFHSRYLTMRDGVRIAVDVYVPKGAKAEARVPTVLVQTRYFRAHRAAFPGNLFFTTPMAQVAERYAKRGYALMVVDVRGSGASFGTRTQEWSPDEQRDGSEIVDWIVKQPWSNGRVGSMGASYDGTAALYLLATGNPAVRAIAPSALTFDAYADVAFPGGVKQAPFIEFWGRATAALDSNEFGNMLSWGERLLYRGVPPVQGDSGEALLLQARAQHRDNYNVAQQVSKVEFSDQTTQTRDMSPYIKLDAITKSGAAILSIDGWYDAGYINSSIKTFLSAKTPGSRLLLGPWTHQLDNQSPWKTPEGEYHSVGIIDFFDHYLKDVATPDTSAIVRYFTVAEERWKTSPTWPPPGIVERNVYLAAQALSDAAPIVASAADEYQVDSTTGTGHRTRWNNQTALDIQKSMPLDRAERDKKLLVYDGPPLAADLEVTGHPMANLFVSSSGSDGAVFVYLEDVGPNGKVNYVTEGVLRLIMRRTSPSKAPYQFPGPYRTYTTADSMPMQRGEIAEISFDLFPISYLFRAGHHVRIAIAGADVDHFAKIGATPPRLTFYRDAAHASRIILPVMPR